MVLELTSWLPLITESNLLRYKSITFRYKWFRRTFIIFWQSNKKLYKIMLQLKHYWTMIMIRKDCRSLQTHFILCLKWYMHNSKCHDYQNHHPLFHSRPMKPCLHIFMFQLMWHQIWKLAISSFWYKLHASPTFICNTTVKLYKVNQKHSHIRHSACTVVRSNNTVPCTWPLRTTCIPYLNLYAVSEQSLQISMSPYNLLLCHFQLPKIINIIHI